jgi:hypothetical protein
MAKSFDDLLKHSRHRTLGRIELEELTADAKHGESCPILTNMPTIRLL